MTLEHIMAIDQDEAAIGSTLGAPAPRLVEHGAQRASTAIAMPSTGATRQDHVPDTVKGLPRTTTTPGAMPHSARQQGPSTVLPRFGKKRTTPEISRACNPSLLESIKGGRSTHSGTGRHTRTLTRTHNSRFCHSPQSPLAHSGIWELLSLSRSSLYPLLQAPRCKIIQCFPPCWTYSLIGWNQDKSGVIVFSLASTI